MSRVEVAPSCGVVVRLWMPRRYRTDPTGYINDWRFNDSFLVHESSAGAVVFVYPSIEMPGRRAETYLAQQNYSEFVASGIIFPKIQEWKFLKPRETHRCEQIARGIVVDDPQVLEYFASFSIKLPDDSILGSFSGICTQRAES